MNTTGHAFAALKRGYPVGRATLPFRVRCPASLLPPYCLLITLTPVEPNRPVFRAPLGARNLFSRVSAKTAKTVR